MLIMLAIAQSACSNGDAAGGGTGETETLLLLYVFSPGKAIATRANTGYVTAETAERKVNSLQVWVFQTGTNTLAGYMKASADEIEALNSEGGTTLQMVVDKTFAATPTNVDVYVLANINPENSGLEFGINTTREVLEDARMGEFGTTGGNTDPFGLTTLVTAVPNEGLPMSGVIRNQPVVNESPVLRVGTVDALATVQLVRMVSKVLFVFSRSADSEETLNIQGVSIDANMIPKDEYVFLDTPYDERTSNVVTLSYNTDPKELLESPITDEQIGKPEDPGEYVYIAQTSQEYEDLITAGITKGDLSPVGPFYLRETDKALSGKIIYSVGGGANKTAPFKVAAAGDFSRNHTWIVYAHYGTAVLDVITVEVQDWKVTIADPRNLYNW